MSLLGANVYANPNTPLWGSPGGGGGSNATFETVTISQTLDVSGISTFGDDVVGPAYDLADLSGVTVGRVDHVAISQGASADGVMLQGDTIRFGKLSGSVDANTFITPGIFGGVDTIQLGGNATVTGILTAAIGPVPTQLITSAKSVNPIPVAPSGPTSFGVDTTVTGVSNAEYDIQAAGSVFLVSGTIDPSDSVVFTVTTGGGFGATAAAIFPSERLLGGNYITGEGPLIAGGAACAVNIRQRLSPSTSGTIIGANVRVFSPNASTAVYGAGLGVFDVQRVR